MLRAYLFILAGLFLFPCSQVEAADITPAPQARPSSVTSPQDLEAIYVMADQGDAGSQNYLGFLYATGQTVAKDEKTAFGWFQKAADQGHPEALGNLAMMYEKGLGVEKNLRTALALHRQAAMAGYSISMKRLASLYETGVMGEERDPIKAEMWKTRYKETLKASAPAAIDAAPRQAAGKALATAQVEKPASLKPATSSAKTSPQAATASAPGDTQAQPVSPSSLNRASAASTPYFIQVGGKATARETMEVTQKIVEKNLLPQNKKIELVNPDGKSYLINIGPFADEHQAAPYKAKIMALLNVAPPPDPAPRPPVQAAPAQTAAAPPKAPVVPAMAIPSQAQATQPLPAVKTGSGGREKHHYVEVSGKATAREATELIRKIVERGLLPRNMHVELVNPEADNYRIRIGPFADAVDAAPQMAKTNAPVKSTLTPPNTPMDTSQELLPVTQAGTQPVPGASSSSAQKQAIAPVQPKPLPVTAPKVVATPVASDISPKLVPMPVAIPQRQEIDTPQIASVAVPKIEAATAAGDVPAMFAEGKPAATKTVRGRYYYILLNAQNTFEDSMFLTQFLFTKELVHETRRVKIENLDGQNFHVSIGPFSDIREANQQLQKINQQTFLESSIVTLETRVPVSGDGDYQPFIQIKIPGTLGNAVTLTQALVENELFAPKLFVEIAKFGAGNYLLRYGPFKGIKESDQGIQYLKKQFRVSPITINLERLVPVDGKQ